MARQITFMGLPMQIIPRWKMLLLRIRYPRHWFVQRGGVFYIIRRLPGA